MNPSLIYKVIENLAHGMRMEITHIFGEFEKTMWNVGEEVTSFLPPENIKKGDSILIFNLSSLDHLNEPTKWFKLVDLYPDNNKED